MYRCVGYICLLGCGRVCNACMIVCVYKVLSACIYAHICAHAQVCAYMCANMLMLHARAYVGIRTTI